MRASRCRGRAGLAATFVALVGLAVACVTPPVDPGTTTTTTSTSTSPTLTTSTSTSTTTTVPSAHGAVQVSNGGRTACAVVAAGNVYCWGDNWSGSLGSGTPSTGLSRATAAPVVGIGGIGLLTGATKVSSGSDETVCAIVDDGAVACWGDNHTGELGNGSTATFSNTPVAVTGLTGATDISVGFDHVCAVVTGGAVQCWGNNNYGQLGNGTTALRREPAPVTGIQGATRVSAGKSATCALLADGSVRCWGSEQFGQLGNGVYDTFPDGSGRFSTTPVAVIGISDAVDLLLSERNGCAIRATEELSCWGFGHVGVFPNSAPYTATPTGYIDVSELALLGSDTTACLRRNGTVQCWGNNPMIVGPPHTLPYYGPPVTISGLSDVVQISGDLESMSALLSDGTVMNWGRLMGYGGYTPPSSNVPVAVVGLP